MCSANFKRPTLFDIPISNHGARVRFVIYKKGISHDFDTLSPAGLGGLKSPEFLALNPQGKVPLLVLPDGTSLPESEVIVQYLLDKYKDVGPSLRAENAEARAIASLIVRIHDLYISPVQSCMYRAMDVKQRADWLAQLAAQLDAIEQHMLGPYLAGPEVTHADGALVPTFVFLETILPQVFGWPDLFAGGKRKKLQKWWELMKLDPEASKVIGEVRGALQAWEDKDLWTERGIRPQIADPSYKWVY